MENFNELLQKYADFIVRVGVNPQPGQTLIINCPLEGAPLARLCVRSAYEAGARDVQVNWQDDAVTRIRMELGSEDALTDHKGWQLRRYLDYAETEGGVCVLHLIADDPEVFAGLDAHAALGLGVVQITAQLPALVVGQGLFAAQLHAGAGDGVVGPVHLHIPRTRLKGAAHAQPCQRGTFQRTVDDQHLARLGVDPHPDDEIGIFLEKFVKVFHS